MRRITFAAVVVTVLLAVGCSTTQSGFPVRSLPERDDPLALAVQYTPELSSPSAQTERYLDIAESYLERGDAASAAALADYVRTRLTESVAAERPAALQLRLGQLYRQLGDTEAAISQLSASIEQLSSIADEEDRARVIAGLIQTAFEMGEEGFRVLSSATEQILVLEPLSRRVRLLMKTARRYIEHSSPQSVDALIQQALPAAGSIENRYLRGAALGDIAAVYWQIEEEQRADEAMARAVEALPQRSNTELSDDESEALLRLAEHMLTLQRPFQALDVVNRISNVPRRLLGIQAITASYEAEETASAAYIILSQAARSASSVSDPYGRALALARLSRGYVAVGDMQVALIRADAALRALREVGSVSRQVEVRRTLLSVYIAAEAPNRVVTLPDPIGELSEFLSFSAETAVALLDAGQLSAAVQVLAATAGRAAQADDASSEGLADLGWAYARADDTERALSTLTGIGNLSSLVSALTRVGAHISLPLGASGVELLNQLREQLRTFTQPLQQPL